MPLFVLISMKIIAENLYQLKQVRRFIIILFDFQLAFSLEREIATNWIFILITSIIIVFFLILVGLCIFCLIQSRKRRSNINHHNGIHFNSYC